MTAILVGVFLAGSWAGLALATPQDQSHNASGKVSPKIQAALDLPNRFRDKMPAEPNFFWINEEECLVTIPQANTKLQLLANAKTGVVRSSQDDPSFVKAMPSKRLEPLRQARRSRDGGQDTQIQFINRRSDSIKLWWVDRSGKRQPYGSLASQESREQHTFAGHVWQVTDESDTDIAAFRALPIHADAIIDDNTVPASESGEEPATPLNKRSERLSPDGKWKVEFREDNVDLVSQETHSRHRLTKNESTTRSYRGPVEWSPDSSHFVVMQTEEGDNRMVTLIESSPKDQLQPKARQVPYDKPGDRLDVSIPHLFSVAKLEEIPIEPQLFENPWSIGEIRWSPDSRRFTCLFNQRGHQVVRLIAVDVAKGTASTLIEEKSSTFVDYAHKQFHQYLDASNEILWMSERDGWCHLYLFDAETGQLKNQVTRGEWVVRKVERVDEEKRQIWFAAGGIDPKQDPYYLHLGRVDFDGTGLKQLTQGDGTHRWEFSPKNDYFIDSYSRVDLPSVGELRSCQDGKLITELYRSKADPLIASGWQMPERFVAKGRDGVTDIYGIIVRPSHFVPGKKYPIVESIYAGPQSAFVPKAFGMQEELSQIAELGFIVVKIDGMGTSHRSKAFHDVCAKNLADAGFPDRKLWIQAAAKKYPELDLQHVGIYGGSAGGQNALGALLFHGDFYHVAVADCGCHDNRMDKVWWNELWMGWPIGDHYQQQSNVTNAHRLRGELMLVVGELDDNVDPSSTLQVANALQEADKDFELLFMTGKGHGALGSPYARRRMWEFMMRHLQTDSAKVP